MIIPGGHLNPGSITSWHSAIILFDWHGWSSLNYVASLTPWWIVPPQSFTSKIVWKKGYAYSYWVCFPKMHSFSSKRICWVPFDGRITPRQCLLPPKRTNPHLRADLSAGFGVLESSWKGRVDNATLIAHVLVRKNRPVKISNLRTPTVRRGWHWQVNDSNLTASFIQSYFLYARFGKSTWYIGSCLICWFTADNEGHNQRFPGFGRTQIFDPPTKPRSPIFRRPCKNSTWTACAFHHFVRACEAWVPYKA